MLSLLHHFRRFSHNFVFQWSNTDVRYATVLFQMVAEDSLLWTLKIYHNFFGLWTVCLGEDSPLKTYCLDCSLVRGVWQCIHIPFTTTRHWQMSSGIRRLNHPWNMFIFGELITVRHRPCVELKVSGKIIWWNPLLMFSTVIARARSFWSGYLNRPSRKFNVTNAHLATFKIFLTREQIHLNLYEVFFSLEAFFVSYSHLS